MDKPKGPFYEVPTMEDFYVVPEDQHNQLVIRAYQHRGYTEEEARLATRMCADATRHGNRTHNAIKALHLDEMFGTGAVSRLP